MGYDKILRKGHNKMTVDLDASVSSVYSKQVSTETSLFKIPDTPPCQGLSTFKLPAISGNSSLVART